MSNEGVEETVLGTVVMPYCSGLGNLIFAFLLGSHPGSGAEVVTNCLVNNVTNLTLLIGLPAVLWGIAIAPRNRKFTKGAVGGTARGDSVQRLNRLSLLLTLVAVIFFSGVLWALAADGEIDFRDGIVLIALFLFWQTFQVFDVLKNNVRQNRGLSWMLLVDLILLGVGAYGVYISIDWLVTWLLRIENGFVSAKYLGWLSGWLMVLPNALLAIYYGWTRRPEIIYASQVGDAHVCIPLCIGIVSLYKPIHLPLFFQAGMAILIGTTLVHLFFLGVFGRLPRWAGALLVAGYGFFLYKGLFS